MKPFPTNKHITVNGTIVMKDGTIIPFRSAIDWGDEVMYSNRYSGEIFRLNPPDVLMILGAPYANP